MSRPPGVRALGIDLGSKRIGIAVSDLSGTIASALTTVHRSSSRRHDHAEIARLVRDEATHQALSDATSPEALFALLTNVTDRDVA